MKHLRILILVLMSILLPMRGVLAATMMCPGGEGPDAAVVVAEPGHHGHPEMQADHEMHADHSQVHHHAGEGVPDDESSSGEHSTTCHFCASGCCMASIVGTVTSPRQPRLTSSATFPALSAPVAAFQSDGQDRPPRTI